jgi:hypothetical protein
MSQSDRNRRSSDEPAVRPLKTGTRRARSSPAADPAWMEKTVVMLKRSLVFVYGIASYAVFFVTYLYAIGFVGNVFVPRSIDGPSDGDFVGSFLTDLALLALFAIQHSVMARPAFKRWWMRFVPEPAERSTYVLLSSLALIALFAFWRPLGGVVWSIVDPFSVAVL